MRAPVRPRHLPSLAALAVAALATPAIIGTVVPAGPAESPGSGQGFTVSAAPEPLAAPAPAEPEVPTAAPEAYAGHEPQVVCDPAERVGVTTFRDVVLAAYPDTTDGGISRDCSVGGASEHKEGRAWDWMLDANDPDDAAAADEMLDWLLATDETGEPHAIARRAGVLYVIWDGQIWQAARPEAGWQPYTGASPHTDHVHISFSSAGADGTTSFFDDLWDPAVGTDYPATVSHGDVEAAGLS
ncbi:MAG: hypothetical protein WEB09_07245 [Nitriliruptor sp.]